MIPSLFREDITKELFKSRYSAYKELITSIQNDFKKQRFKKDSVGPLLQNYGIKTPWLDLVANLYTAIWFATHNPKNEKTKPKFGWIYFIRTKLDNGAELKYYDLKEEQSSLSLRLHVQHGLSATRKDPAWNFNNRCLNDFVVATVKFRNNDKWKLEGPLFEKKYMFPSELYDSTYRYLKGNKKFINIINDITNKYDLSDGELGRIYEYI